MAKSTAVPNETAVAAPAKVPLLPLLLCSVLTIVLAVGGTAYFVMHTTHTAHAATEPAAAVNAAAKATHNVPLDTMLVNLADEGGHAYLRAGIVLAEEDAPGAKKSEDGAKSKPGADAALRDTLFDTLGRQTSAMLLAPDGKEMLKKQLKDALGKRNPEAKVAAVYFTDFLVQR